MSVVNVSHPLYILLKTLKSDGIFTVKSGKKTECLNVLPTIKTFKEERLFLLPSKSQQDVVHTICIHLNAFNCYIKCYNPSETKYVWAAYVMASSEVLPW